MREAYDIAADIRAMDTWDMDLCRELCEAAGMLQEWTEADGESFEAVVFAAAEKLGVAIAVSPNGTPAAMPAGRKDRVMKSKFLDGWHVICGYDVYVEAGRILRGVKKDRNGGEVTCYPYRASRDGHSWYNDSGVTVSAFRAAVRRGTMIMS